MKSFVQLLYSVYSTACIINPGYSNAETSNHPLDVFSTHSLTSSLLVESQFRQIGTPNGTYDSQMLNDSAGIIKETLSSGSVTSPAFLFATLAAYNATGSHSGTTNGEQSSPTTTIATTRGHPMPFIGAFQAHSLCKSLITWTIISICLMSHYQYCLYTFRGPLPLRTWRYL